MQEVMIRQANRQDAAQLCQLLDSVTQQTPYLLYDKLSVTQEEQLIDYYDKQDNCVLIVAQYGNQLIGMANLIGGTHAHTTHSAEIGVCVLQDYWEYGIGTALVQEVMDYAMTHNVRLITLEVAEQNERAIRLYKKQGFTQCGHYKNRLCYNGVYYHTIVMTHDTFE